MVSRTPKAHQLKIPWTDDAHEDQRSAMGCLTTNYGMQQAAGAKDRDMCACLDIYVLNRMNAGRTAGQELSVNATAWTFLALTILSRPGTHHI